MKPAAIQKGYCCLLLTSSINSFWISRRSLEGVHPPIRLVYALAGLIYLVLEPGDLRPHVLQLVHDGAEVEDEDVLRAQLLPLPDLSQNVLSSNPKRIVGDGRDVDY
jgi:hypothetical protein